MRKPKASPLVVIKVRNGTLWTEYLRVRPTPEEFMALGPTLAIINMVADADETVVTILAPVHE